MPAQPLFGRDRAAALLGDELRRTTTRHGGLVLVTGEAGIGKTALVSAVVAEFVDADIVTATGWSGDETPGYWAWVQILRGLRRSAPGAWSSIDEATKQTLSQLLVELPTPHPSTDPATTFLLGDAISEALVRASARRPVIVIIDDLQRADPASAKVLSFVARHTWFERLAVVATVRDTEVRASGHPLRDLYSDLLDTARTVALGPLQIHDIENLIETTTGQQPPPETLPALHTLTAGNPFLVEQVAHVWATDGAADDLSSPGMRAILDVRMALLPAATVDLLTTAAMVGNEFTVAVVAAATDVPFGEAVRGLDTAARAGLLRSHPDDRFTFVHDLVHEHLREGIGAVEGQQRHASLVRALQQLPFAVSGATANDLAHHAYLAGNEIDAEHTLQYLSDAASQAEARFAAEESARHLRRALTLVPDRHELRGRLVLDLARSLVTAGELDDARHSYQSLLIQADQWLEPELFARAALGLHGLGMRDPERSWPSEMDTMTRAHRMMVAHSPTDPLTIHLLAASIRVQVHTSSSDDLDDASSRNLSSARECGDETALGMSLLAHHDAIWRPGTAPQRLQLADELIRIERRSGLEFPASGRVLRFAALLEMGDPQAYIEIETFRGTADHYRWPRHRYVAYSRAGTVAALSGDIRTARSEMDAAYALGEQLGEVDRLPLWLEQRWHLAILHGDLDTARRLVARYRNLDGGYTGVPELITAAEEGDVDAVAAAVSRVKGLVEVYPRHFRPALLVALARAAIVLDDDMLRESVREQLLPLRDSWAVVAGGGVVYGPYAYWLGKLDAMSGASETAVDHLRVAAAAANRLRANPWMNAVENELRLLGDDRARRHIDFELRTQTTDGSTTPNHPEQRPDNEFRRNATMWTLQFAGRTVHAPDAKGLHDLHFLLSNPDREIPASVLLGGSETANRAARPGSDPVLDDRAKAAYRQRLDTLDNRIEDALARGADQRAAELDHERTALLEELRRAAGLAGRTRRLGDAAERARKTVSARIRDSLRRLDDMHPELAEHLRARVSLGVYCRYQPINEAAWLL